MSKKRAAIVVGSFCILLGLILGGSGCSSLMDKPLGPSLKGSSTSQPGTNSNSNFNSNSNPLPAPGTLASPVQTPAQGQANQVRPLCGNVPVLTVLAVGIDFRGDNYLYGLADVIRIIRIDFTTHKVSVLTLDRAIWVEIPGISAHYGITHGLLNQAYFYGVPAMGYYTGPAGGAGLLAETLQKNFDLNVDNYAVVDFRAFVKIVDALDGIDVNLPAPVDGNVNGNDFGFFNAGTHHLSGAQALNLARIREGYSTLIRDSNQDQIIKGIYAKVTSPAIISRLPQLLLSLKGAGLTGLSARQIEDMLCLVRKMDTSTDLTFRSIPDKYYIYSWIYDQDMHQDINIWKIDFNVFRSYIADFMKGEWPQE